MKKKTSCAEEKRVLIITHSGNLTYGAAKSLKLLLNTLPLKFDIVFDKLLLKTYSRSELADYCGKNCVNMFFFYLPVYFEVVDYYYRTFQSASISYKINRVLKRLKRGLYYLFDKRKLKLLTNRPYCSVYLNSSTLYSMIRGDKRTIVHVRELMRNPVPRNVGEKFLRAGSLICIDDATRGRLIDSVSGIDKKRISVITNPFDMRAVSSVDSDSVLKRYNIDGNKIVFLIAGLINEDKGVGFVADAFSKIGDKNVILLIAGKPSPLSNRIKEANLKNVALIGEIENMDEIYGITDCLVRGEIEFCTGRTFYEALYSGCQTLIPGTQDDLSRLDFEPDQKSRIHFYTPRNLNDLIEKVKKIHKIDKSMCVNDNLTSFADKMMRVLQNGSTK